jgi:hypothetical protein
MARAEIRVYEDPKDDSFNKSGLPDDQKEAYDQGWDEGMSQEEEQHHQSQPLLDAQRDRTDVAGISKPHNVVRQQYQGCPQTEII